MERPPAQILQYLTELEQKAEDLLAERRQIIDLDRRRQKTREAMRALQKDTSGTKTWMCVNNMFIKLPKSKAQALLKQDFDQLDTEITALRDGLKKSVDKLRDVESKESLKGFSLNPLTKQELDAIKDVL